MSRLCSVLFGTFCLQCSAQVTRQDKTRQDNLERVSREMLQQQFDLSSSNARSTYFAHLLFSSSGHLASSAGRQRALSCKVSSVQCSPSSAVRQCSAGQGRACGRAGVGRSVGLHSYLR
ncbi:hypothetical protein BZA05DRAFT_153360 [Tricharina praecox]|uniref:uncharacterized protein n=1 Tax=Tricharina praecox TaxID=43433 RepID=UPI00221F5D2A|nr:uncharacterized protein BZA05DRAFT_153360 [Tricharina praecox]KAI5844884.1 hypothetical protein BZA05DRAFT_153360 [Tricharina praecox]